MQIDYEIRREYKGYILIRKHGIYSQHGHMKTLTACHEVIKLIELNKLP